MNKKVWAAGLLLMVLGTVLVVETGNESLIAVTVVGMIVVGLAGGGSGLAGGG
jgi:hypothetical protein